MVNGGSRMNTPGSSLALEDLESAIDVLIVRVAELERVSAQRGQLLGLVMNAQEQERFRIAEGIHDDSLQSVVAVGLRLAMFRRQVEDPAGIAALDEVQETVEHATERLRSVLFELRPHELQRAGLVPALRSYLGQIRREEGLEFVLDDRLESEPDPDMRTFLYRLAQEVLMNVRKHAQARCVEVAISRHGANLVLRVHDDGVGFDPAEVMRPSPGHFGLAALTEQLELAGGVIRIESAPGAGATVEIEVPAVRS